MIYDVMSKGRQAGLEFFGVERQKSTNENNRILTIDKTA